MSTLKLCVEAKIQNPRNGFVKTEIMCGQERPDYQEFAVDKADETDLKIKIIKANSGNRILEMQTKRYSTTCVTYGSGSSSRDLKDFESKCQTVLSDPVYEESVWGKFWDWVMR